MIHIYTVNRNHVDLCLQGSVDLHKCISQMNQNIAQILVCLQWRSFDVLSGVWCEFDVVCLLLEGLARPL